MHFVLQFQIVYSEISIKRKFPVREMWANFLLSDGRSSQKETSKFFRRWGGTRQRGCDFPEWDRRKEEKMNYNLDGILNFKQFLHKLHSYYFA